MPRHSPSSTHHDTNTATVEAVASTSRELRAMLENDVYMEETPLEVQMTMGNALCALDEALRLLTSAPFPASQPVPRSANLPTPKQGQFLAYIDAYMRTNHAGLAPTHARLQRHFNLTAPSVNSMLVRLEERGFIRRIAGQPRGITLTIDPALLPPLERPFK